MSKNRSKTVAIEPIPPEILDVGELPRSGVDARGRLLPLTEEERKAQSERMRLSLERVEAIPEDETDSDEIWEAFMRGIDEGRPHRKLFEGRY